MKVDLLLRKSFKGTSIDVEKLRKFLLAKPSYLIWGIDLDLRRRTLHILNCADYVEFHLRMFLLGEPKTPYRVLREVRTFSRLDANAAHYFVSYSLAMLKQEILGQEWYELMPRMNYAIEKIKPLIPSPKGQTEPLLLYIIREFYPGHARMQ